MATTKKAETTAHLVQRYNTAAKALGRKAVKKFADRKSAERRVKAIEAELKPTSLQAPRADDWRDRVGETRSLTFDFKPAKQKSPPREASMRAVLLEQLEAAGKKGVSFEELHKAAGFANRASTRDAIRLLAVKNGYGIKGTGESVTLTK